MKDLVGLNTSERQQKYKFVVQRGNWKKLHIWKDVGESPDPEEAKKMLVEHRAKDFKHPYRCVRYLIFNLPKYQTLADCNKGVEKVIESARKTNKELNDKSRVDHRKLEEPMTD